MRVIVFILSFVVLPHGLFSQDIGIQTPEVYSFKREVFCPVSYYTGQANISIPIYTIAQDGLAIPVSLKYCGGEGLRTTNRYSSVGFGWRLTAGGVISRTIKGVPDESSKPKPELKGFLHMPENHVSKETVRNNPDHFLNHLSNGDAYFDSEYECSPDIFTFSFLGYSGYFVMDYDKTIHVQSNDHLVVKILKITETTEKVSTDRIVLTDPNGLVFTFGGDISSVEYSQAIGKSSIVNAWYLTSIEFPNKEKIIFKYDQDANKIPIRAEQLNDITYTKPAIITEILFRGGSVTFNNTDITQTMESEVDRVKMISHITVSNHADDVRNIGFNYSKRGVNGEYVILDSLSCSGPSSYKFDYHRLKDLPARDSYGKDFWGFYNGKQELASVDTRSVLSDRFFNTTSIIEKKQPDAELSKIGILTSITFPTGGTEEYEYEPNTYSLSGTVGSTGYYLFPDVNPKTTGGLRIASIKLDGQLRKYKYVSDFNPDKPDFGPGMSPIEFTSSGILHREPSILAFNKNVINQLSVEGEPFITYSKVVELFEDKSYKIYQMNSLSDIPDQGNTYARDGTRLFTFNASDDKVYQYYSKEAFINAFGERTPCAIERGQVKSIINYDAKNQKQQEHIFHYGYDDNRYSNSIPGIYLGNSGGLAADYVRVEMQDHDFHYGFWHSYNIYTFPVFLRKEEIIDYVDGIPKQKQTINHYYNNERLEKETTRNDSKNGLFRTIYKYPADFPSQEPYTTMVSKNILSPVVEQTDYYNDDFLMLKRTGYMKNNDMILPSIVETQAKNQLAPEKNVQYHRYDKYGNPTCLSYKGGPKIVYIWGYKGLYPIAKIQSNTTADDFYDLVTGIIGSGMDILDNNPAEERVFEILQRLQDHEKMQTSQISYYTYNPLVGITSETDPSGRTVFYEYDTFGRLWKMRDESRNLIKDFQYNYQQ